MKTKLITGLRTAAAAIEAGTFSYEWKYPSRCNCGALFCALTGTSASELKVPVPMDKNTAWTNIVGQFCPITGMPSHELFKELFSYGLTQQDIVNLEALSDPKVIARINFEKLFGEEITAPAPAPAQRKWYQITMPKPRLTETKRHAVRRKLIYHNKNHAVAYMRAWADLLQKEGAMDAATLTTTQETQAQQP